MHPFSRRLSLSVHLRRNPLSLLRCGLTLTLLFLSLSHSHPGFAAALWRPVQHLCVCVPAKRQLPHKRTQEPGVAQQLQAADRDAEEGKEEPAGNRGGFKERLASQDLWECGWGLTEGFGEGETALTIPALSFLTVPFSCFIFPFVFLSPVGWDLMPGALQKCVFW